MPPPCVEPVPEVSTIIRDVDYFMEPIFIRVEDAIFQIAKHYLMQISIFSTTLSLPPTEDGVEGLTEKRPFILQKISKDDFKGFLKVMIPLQMPYSYLDITADEWISTLKLSTMWEVTVFRDLAIRHMTTKLEAVDMILLGSEYRVSQWFIVGCIKLINGTRGPTEEEGERLGMCLTVRIYGIREQFLSFRQQMVSWHSTNGPKPTPQFDYQRAVREAFPNKIFD